MGHIISAMDTRTISLIDLLVNMVVSIGPLLFRNGYVPVNTQRPQTPGCFNWATAFQLWIHKKKMRLSRLVLSRAGFNWATAFQLWIQAAILSPLLISKKSRFSHISLTSMNSFRKLTSDEGIFDKQSLFAHLPGFLTPPRCVKNGTFFVPLCIRLNRMFLINQGPAHQGSAISGFDVTTIYSFLPKPTGAHQSPGSAGPTACCSGAATNMIR